MARVQLALNVPDLDEAVAFYTTLLGVDPHKRRPGYVNFMVVDPPLKLVLFEQQEVDRLNHLGIEVDSTEEVVAVAGRLAEAGLTSDVREQELCCHAVQDKVWTEGPDGSWEVYAVTDDASVPVDVGACC
jgi:catechol 2,3-dioxygenase-like lactoylglutathione lyase family enzyme